MLTSFDGRTTARRIRLVQLLVLLILPFSVRAQQQAESNNQIWPEVDLYIPLNEKFRLFAMGRVNQTTGASGSTQAQLGVHLDYFLTKRWSLRGGYRRLFSLGDSTASGENRIILEETYNKPLPKRFVFADRNRQDLRWISGDFSARLRNRVRLERDFALGKRSLVPYGAGEIFYDTRFSTFSRYRIMVGTEFMFKKREGWLLNLRRQKVLDFYYVRQYDTRPQHRHTNAFGIIIAFHF